MGLTLMERRIFQEFKNDPYVIGFQDTIQKITNTQIPIEVDWASVENTEQAEWVLRDKAKWVRTYFFSYLEEAFKQVCSDTMGQEAVKEKITKIALTNTEHDTGLSLVNGVFTLRTSLRGNGCPDTASIKEYLERNL